MNYSGPTSLSVNSFVGALSSGPLRFFGWWAGALAAGTLTGMVLSIQRYIGKPLSDRPMLIFAVLLIVLDIQLFALDLLGKLIIFSCGKRLRQYQLQKIYVVKHSPDGLCAANGRLEAHD